MDSVDSYLGQTLPDSPSLGVQSPVSSSTPPESVDPLLVQQTKAEIRRLVREIAQISQSDLPLEEFFEQFLGRVVSALASVGGAIWTMDENGSLRLRYHVNFSQTRLAEDEAASARHALLLNKTARHAQSVLVPPGSVTESEKDSGNPTEWLLVLGILTGDDGVQGIVEIFQRPNGGPVTQRGYLRFLTQMCDLASDYLKNRRLRQFTRDRQLWRHTEQFVQAIHDSLDLRATAYAIANEGRRLLEADRVSVAVRRGRKYEVLAVSGLDTIDRRAEEVARMSDLATVVAATGEPFWHPAADTDLPPQLESVVGRYVDKSHSRTIGVLPLRPPDETAEPTERQDPSPVGVLIVDRFTDSGDAAERTSRAETAVRHGAAALGNALTHHSLPLLPLVKGLAKLKSAFGPRSLPKTTAVLAAAVATMLGLALIPAELRIRARGILQPAVQQHIFARIGGTVEEVPVVHGQMVEAEQELVRMSNNDLELDITTLVGRKTSTSERRLAIQGTLLKHANLPPEERNRLSGELTQLEQSEESIERQLELYRRKQKQLTVRSPRPGQVVTWHVSDALQERPVQKGQILMSIIDPDSDWYLELDVAESDIRHVIASAKQPSAGELDRDESGNGNDALSVSFALHSHPGREFEGQIVEIQKTAEARSQGEGIVVVRVAVNETELPELRSGTTVNARIHCGSRPVGYVWFRNLIDTVQSEVLFWL
ncbi:MAG: efflux RND transporter periplasmic adaptor subunit [Pirellulaceae bacterium]|nr:efflux RND transporter periplasmic adaptor subunit [Pirellulaceae bacterium]